MRILALVVVALASVSALAQSSPGESGGAGGLRIKRDYKMHITIDLQEADIVNVIRLLGDVSGKNFVVGEDVKGKVTLKLRDVTWYNALDAVLKSKDLGSQISDDIVYVRPQAVLDAAEERKLDLLAKSAQQGPLTTHVVPLNYADAKQMAAKVQPLLSPRGSVVVDERTNTLIIRDVRGSGATSF